ncbi:hypothetical protein GJAV_G00188090 [Gymnothorax javanicus]|nr:hypothetical protein GJAV_G00188090 [Gymnothorax javanicus]
MFDSTFENFHQLRFDIIKILTFMLESFCREADPQNFKGVTITGFGKTFVYSVAEYNYPNNATQIAFLNDELMLTLESIFNNFKTNNDLIQTLGNATLELVGIVPQPTEILNITDLRPYVTCSLDFANFTLEVDDGSWKCFGPCKKIPNYCNGHGSCFNMKTGPFCECHSSPMEQYDGEQCELLRWGSGFYTVLFSAVGAVLLLISILVVAVMALRRKRKLKTSPRKSNIPNGEPHASDEDFFNFFSTGIGFSNGGLQARSGLYELNDSISFANEFSSSLFNPSLEYVNSSFNVKIKRPELMSSFPDG